MGFFDIIIRPTPTMGKMVNKIDMRSVHLIYFFNGVLMGAAVEIIFWIILASSSGKPTINAEALNARSKLTVIGGIVFPLVQGIISIVWSNVYH